MFVALIALVVAMSGVAVAAKGTIGGKDIKKNAIKTSKIKDGAVTGPKIAKGAVEAANLAPGAIPASSLADGSVTTPKLANGAATTAKIADDAVTATELADGGVGTPALADGGVTAAKLADGAVTGAKLADGAVTTAKLDPSERSEGFTAKHTAAVSLATGTDTVAIQTTLPTPGDYLFTISAELGSVGATTSVSCDLLDANNPVASAIVPMATGQFAPSISLTGASDGGIVRLRCTPSPGAGQARNLFFSAVRVGSVTPLASTP
jgi:hypothetical protein